tara:strand:+ start:2157 stop:2393 length:237 start_codon:yes stop_codon:yes gene_type:complete
MIGAICPHPDTVQLEGNPVMKVLAGLLLVMLAMFCGYGFLASFEFPGITPWKIGYATAGVILLMAAIGTLRSAPKNRG